MKKGFLWGGSTSAFQFEGGSHEGNKGKSIYDTKEEQKGIRYSLASDFYHHYHEDIELMSEMGFSAFRMSISWTRIYPNGIEKEPNQEGIKFYKNVFIELKKHNIEPVVTLFHWDMPQYLVDHYDGFKSKKTIECFKKYVRTCFEEFGKYVKYWITLNENNLSMLIPWMYVKDSDNNSKDKEQLAWDCYYNSLICHFYAVKLCHELLPQALIGNMTASALAYPLTPKPEDVLATQRHNQETMWDDLDIITTGKISQQFYKKMLNKGVRIEQGLDEKSLMSDPKAKIDFISFSYYYSICMQTGRTLKKNDVETMQMLYQGYYNPYLDKTDFGWQIDSVGLRIFMNEVYERYHLPLMVVENGIGVENEKLTKDKKVHDDYRIYYLAKHIKEVKKSVEMDKIPVLGYLPWGCIDLYSASGNYKKRYGFVYVDFDGDLSRYKKDSFYWYKKVIESNGENLGEVGN